jgi:hypothetical protein
LKGEFVLQNSLVLLTPLPQAMATTSSPAFRCVKEFILELQSNLRLNASTTEVPSHQLLSPMLLYGKLFSDTDGYCLCVGKNEVALLYD